MNVNELIKYLLSIKNNGKGLYSVVDDGYLNEIDKEDIRIDDENNEIIL